MCACLFFAPSYIFECKLVLVKNEWYIYTYILHIWKKNQTNTSPDEQQEELKIETEASYSLPPSVKV